jgi:hypothetical protein
VTPGRIFHYTNDVGYKAISSQRTWVFRSSEPPGNHPVGAYFTTLAPDSINLTKRLRISKDKLSFVFCFTDNSDLTPIDGGRGEYIRYSRTDYSVEEGRQRFHGTREQAMEQLQ